MDNDYRIFKIRIHGSKSFDIIKFKSSFDVVLSVALFRGYTLYHFR